MVKQRVSKSALTNSNWLIFNIHIKIYPIKYGHLYGDRFYGYYSSFPPTIVDTFQAISSDKKGNTMDNYLVEILATTTKLFALMTPPAVLSAFLSGTKQYDEPQRRKTALKTSCAVFIIGIVLFFFGNAMFSVFGFTLDAFRIGSGALLFITAVTLMNDSPEKNKIHSDDDDISVVPLAIPLCMGPASIGTIIVMGTSSVGIMQNLIGALSLLIASSGIYAMLLCAKSIAKVLKNTGIAILSKLTGLLISAIAAQVVFTGVAAFLK